jgi:hypothetical protein
MFKKVTYLAALAAVAALGFASLAMASGGGGIQKQGVCTGSSSSVLKAKLDDNGMIEVDWEVDSNVVGQTWAWRLLDNGVLQFKGHATTQAPSGSFSIQRFLTNEAGTDKIKAVAKNPDTGESCHATLSI